MCEVTAAKRPGPLDDWTRRQEYYPTRLQGLGHYGKTLSGLFTDAEVESKDPDGEADPFDRSSTAGNTGKRFDS